MKINATTILMMTKMIQNAALSQKQNFCLFFDNFDDKADN